MYAAITVAAFMNIYWMYLIVNQLVRVVKRLASGHTSDPGDSIIVSALSDDEGGATPSGMNGLSDDEETN